MTDKQKPSPADVDVLEMWRCPQLGGPVTFHYCRVMNGGLPCPRVLGCWHADFDVAAFVESNYSLEQIQSVFGVPSKDRWTRIVEALKKATSADPGQPSE